MSGIEFGIGVLAGLAAGALLLRLGMAWHEKILTGVAQGRPAFGPDDGPIAQTATGTDETQDEDVE